MSQTNNAMLDMEFLGKPPSARIASIGVQMFNPVTGDMGATFYRRIKWADKNDQLLPMDPSTVEWWLKQEPDAIVEITDSAERVPLFDALVELAEFLKENGGFQVAVWGNGSDCDNVILAGAYESYGLPVPWQFWNSRDCRTVKSMCQDLKGFDPTKQLTFKGVKHHALHDATYQAEWVHFAYRALANLATRNAEK